MGPNAELTYWRRLLARFSSIIEHIKSPVTQKYIEFLTKVKSKHMKVWLIKTYTAINSATTEILYTSFAEMGNIGKSCKNNTNSFTR